MFRLHFVVPDRKRSLSRQLAVSVRFDDHGYSVPVAWGHHPIMANGSCDELVLCRGLDAVAPA